MSRIRTVFIVILLVSTMWMVGSYSSSTAGLQASAEVGDWIGQPPLPTPRALLSATISDSGRIYAIGGTSDFSTGLATTEAFDPMSGSWDSLPDMSVPRQRLAVAEAPDGRVFAIGGGFNPASPKLSIVEVFDPTAESWTSAPSMPTARDNLAAVTAADGKIYAIGGIESQGSPGLKTVEIYDPGTGTWSTGPELNTGRWAMAAVPTDDGKIYVVGGFAVSGGGAITVGNTEVYDTNTGGGWDVLISDMPTPRGYLGLGEGSDGRIYAFGGNIGDATHLTDVEVFDPVVGSWSVSPREIVPGRSTMGYVTSSAGEIFSVGGLVPGHVATDRVDKLTFSAGDGWQTGTPMDIGRAHFGIAAVDGSGVTYVVGGEVLDTEDPTRVSAKVEQFDPDVGAWSSVVPMNQPRTLFGASSIDQTVYALGGDDAGFDGHPIGPTGTIEYLDTSAESPDWVFYDGELVTPRHSHSVVKFNDSIFVFGGLDGPGAPAVSLVERFTPAAGSVPFDSMADSPRWGMAVVAFEDEIWTIGGFTLGGGAQVTVDAFDPNAAPGSRWSSKDPLPEKVGYATATVGSDGSLYVIGGSDGDGIGKTLVQRYSSADGWAVVTDVPQLNLARWGTGSVAIGSSIYAVGGKPASASPTTSVEFLQLGDELPPNVELGESQTVTLTETVFLPVQISDDPDDDSWIVNLDWGDGASDEVSLSSIEFPPVFEHQFDQGEYLISVCVTDSTGLIGCDETTVVAERGPAPGRTDAPDDAWTAALDVSGQLFGVALSNLNVGLINIPATVTVSQGDLVLLLDPLYTQAVIDVLVGIDLVFGSDLVDQFLVTLAPPQEV